MKKAALILLFSLSICAQEATENLYSRSLKACLEKEIQTYSKFSNRDLRNVIVRQDNNLTKDLPTQFGEIKVEYLDDSGLVQRYKMRAKNNEKTRGEIPVIEIYPIYDKGSKLRFAYSNFWFSYAEKGGFFSRKNTIYKFGLEGGCQAEIGFDPAQQKFVIEKVELWGI